MAELLSTVSCLPVLARYGIDYGSCVKTPFPVVVDLNDGGYHDSVCAKITRPRTAGFTLKSLSDEHLQLLGNLGALAPVSCEYCAKDKAGYQENLLTRGTRSLISNLLMVTTLATNALEWGGSGTARGTWTLERRWVEPQLSPQWLSDARPEGQEGELFDRVLTQLKATVNDFEKLLEDMCPINPKTDEDAWFAGIAAFDPDGLVESTANATAIAVLSKASDHILLPQGTYSSKAGILLARLKGEDALYNMYIHTDDRWDLLSLDASVITKVNDLTSSTALSLMFEGDHPALLWERDDWHDDLSKALTLASDIHVRV